MIRRTIDISDTAVKITSKLDQLKIDSIKGKALASIPCEDIECLIFENQFSSITNRALASLSKAGSIVVICGYNHLPVGILLPISKNYNIVKRLNMQIAASVNKTLLDNLWKTLVIAKIKAQALNLKNVYKDKLIKISETVLPGDNSNVEGYAARLYWDNYLEEGFKRNKNSNDINIFLNYTYSIIRASLARHIVASGLNPSIGIHHSGRSNTFCLADDLIEPLRPIADELVREVYLNGYTLLDKKCKEKLINVMYKEVNCAGTKSILMIAINKMVNSYVKSLEYNTNNLLIPVNI